MIFESNALWLMQRQPVPCIDTIGLAMSDFVARIVWFCSQTPIQAIAQICQSPRARSEFDAQLRAKSHTMQFGGIIASVFCYCNCMRVILVIHDLPFFLPVLWKMITNVDGDEEWWATPLTNRWWMAELRINVSARCRTMPMTPKITATIIYCCNDVERDNISLAGTHPAMHKYLIIFHMTHHMVGALSCPVVSRIVAGCYILRSLCNICYLWKCANATSIRAFIMFITGYIVSPHNSCMN